ncbi:MAG: nucleotidyl transferase AbiEii/AbiGii toxin family protein [Acidobacteria bacterium]|nr:MAG: nucleotidyl transferase AbiEii/AbiGii toxin family protein [Acidobacteriota bacterium]
MSREVRNVGASVRARLLARARAEKTDYQILLTRYALERLLYRLSVSDHRDSFILKGAMLFVTWLHDPFRPTRDLDLLGYGANDTESLTATFKAICATQVPDDGVTFDIEGLTAAPIREELEYGGVRVQTYAVIDGARIPIQIDIGFGDIITPGPVEIAYPVLLDSPAPHLRAYPMTTVVAEKFNAIVVLGIANSRLKDFYDLWLISRTFEFDGAELSAAVQRTFERRETPMHADVPTGLTRLYAEQWNTRWRAFLGREHMTAAPADLNQILDDLRRFLVPLMSPLGSHWPAGGPWADGA